MVLQPNTANGHSIGIGSELVNACPLAPHPLPRPLPKIGYFSHWLKECQQSSRRWFQTSERDIGGGHTIYLNGTKWLEKNHMAQKKSLPTSGLWVGSVRPPETQIFISGLMFQAYISWILAICVTSECVSADFIELINLKKGWCI